MAAEGFLTSLLVLTLAGALGAFASHRLRLPAVAGLLVAGFLVGPTAPWGPVVDPAVVGPLRDLGLVILLFALGVEFDLRRMAEVRSLALLAAATEVGLMLLLGFAIGRLGGLDLLESVLVAGVIAISSTAIVSQTLLQSQSFTERDRRVVVGILLVEDLAAVAFLAIVGALVAPAGSLGIGALGSLGSLARAGIGAVLVVRAAALVVLFVLAALALGFAFVPSLLARAFGSRSEPTWALALVALALGIALAGALFGMSLALGAYLAGAVVGESGLAVSALREIRPLRDIFGALFFLGMGALFDPHVAAANLSLLVVLAIAAIGGKFLAVAAGTLLAGESATTATRVGAGLATIGEFSLAIGVVGAAVFPALGSLAVAICFVGTLAAPFLTSRVAPAIVGQAEGLAKRAPGVRPFGRRSAPTRAAHSGGPPEGTVPARPRGNAWARFATWAGAALAPLLLAAFLSAELTASFAVDTIKIGTPAGGFDFEPALAVVWFAAALLASPGLWTLLRRLAAAVSTLAHALVPAGIHGATEAELVAAALEGAVALAITAVVAFGILALRAALPPLPTLAIAFASAFLVAAALRRPLDALRRNLERAVGALSGDPSPPRNREDLLRALREGYPWGVEIETVTVPANALGAGQSLADLGLRQRTGASVVAIERRGERLLSPGPLSRLEPGDIIVLLGTHDQVQAARERIREALDVPLVGNPDFAVEPVVVAGDSRLVGKRLAEARIRESSGALVVGWQQPQGEPVPNPPPDTLLGEGDLLLLLGTPDQVRRARERVTAGV